MLLHTQVNKITKVTTHSDQIRGQWTQHTGESTGATEDNQVVLLGWVGGYVGHHNGRRILKQVLKCDIA